MRRHFNSHQIIPTFKTHKPQTLLLVAIASEVCIIDMRVREKHKYWIIQITFSHSIPYSVCNRHFRSEWIFIFFGKNTRRKFTLDSFPCRNVQNIYSIEIIRIHTCTHTHIHIYYINGSHSPQNDGHSL